MATDDNRQSGVSGLIAAVTVLSIIAVLALIGWHLFESDQAVPVTLATTQPRQAPDAAARALRPVPPGFTSPVLWLGANWGNGPFDCPGQITQQIYRQALLVAGRDELGLQTRDESLREWYKMSPNSSILRILFEGPRMFVIQMEFPKFPQWERQYHRDMPDRYPSMIEEAEKLSRTEFVDLLRRRGWSGAPDSERPDGPAPADSDALLGRMEGLSALAAVRETHALIRNDGESLPRLGILVRAYANLGQLTRFHWSVEYADYAARSLIYAQRMVAMHPDSAFALWHRAYALALAGFQNDALKDLSAAAALKDGPMPTWAPVVNAFCRYQPDRLVELAKSDPADRPLATYLAFVAVENSGVSNAIVSRADAGLAASPRCLRLIDGEFFHGDLQLLQHIAELGPLTLNQTLGDALASMPGLDAATEEKIDAAKRSTEYPHSRRAECDALYAQGAPQTDRDEPSLGAVSRFIEEATFAQVRRTVQYELFAGDSERKQIPATVALNEPMLHGHPFAFLFKAYADEAAGDRDLARTDLAHHPWISTHITPMMGDLAIMTQQFGVVGSNGADENNRWIQRYTDDNSFDLELEAALYGFDPDNEWLAEQMGYLAKVGPQSPYLCVWNIHAHWDADRAREWEQKFGDFPAVAQALADKYHALHQWSDAERCQHLANTGSTTQPAENPPAN